MENFKVVALQYLDDWYRYDKDFVTNLSLNKSREVRLCSLQEAANHYGIIRNFKTLPEKGRLDNALKDLDSIGDSITDENVDSNVLELAEKFRKAYGKRAISAASKLLWIRHQAPIVIYDGRAIRCLNEQCGGTLGQGDYPKYRGEWRRQFAKREDCIRSACAKLVRVKDFSLAYASTDEDLERVVNNGWFHDRVFDTFLWLNGAVERSRCGEDQTLP